MKSDINKAEKRKQMGRPIKDVDEKILANLSQIGCTQEEIGSIVGISARTLQRRFADLLEVNKNKGKARKFMSGFTLLEPRDIADAIMFAVSVRWRSNISTIEISGTEQSPGGVPIIPVKDPILS